MGLAFGNVCHSSGLWGFLFSLFGMMGHVDRVRAFFGEQKGFSRVGFARHPRVMGTLYR